ncbi:MAG: chloride channel protein [Acidobacteriaceae bacterium]
MPEPKTKSTTPTHFVPRKPLYRMAAWIERVELRRVVDSVLLGLVGAMSALAFHYILRLCSWLFMGKLAHTVLPEIADSIAPRSIAVTHFNWWIPVATTLGGLISGILVFTLAPEAEGHGTDTVVNAFHRLAGNIRARVPVLKMVASGITIGSGGSAGREGPTALIAAGFGTIYANLTRRSDQERRFLILVGMAAGLSAVFRSPIGTAIFAVEVLYSAMEFESHILIYTLLSSVVAYATNGIFFGLQPLFHVPSQLLLPDYRYYPWYVALGLASGLLATILPVVFYGMRDVFHAIPCPQIFKPAIGGLGVGIIALFFPQILGGGYGWMQMSIGGYLPLHLLVALLFLKILSLAFTVSSGGSGGVFAPSLFIGAMLGGTLAALFHQPAAGFVIVGMAAVFGAAARVPMATILMVSEMTGGYQLLVPAGLAVILAFLVQTWLSRTLRYHSLYEAQVKTYAQSPAHYVEEMNYAIDLIRAHRIAGQQSLREMDIISLMQSGIPLTLHSGERMLMGEVQQNCPLCSELVGSLGEITGDDNLKVLAIFRGSEVLLPSPQSRLRAGDGLLLLCSPETEPILKEKLLLPKATPGPGLTQVPV